MTIMFLSHTARVVGQSAAHAACASYRSSPTTAIKQVSHKSVAGELPARISKRAHIMSTCNILQIHVNM